MNYEAAIFRLTSLLEKLGVKSARYTHQDCARRVGGAQRSKDLIEYHKTGRRRNVQLYSPPIKPVVEAEGDWDTY